MSFDRTINLGQILTAGFYLLSLITFVVKLDMRVNVLEQTVNDLNKSQTSISETLKRITDMQEREQRRPVKPRSE